MVQKPIIPLSTIAVIMVSAAFVWLLIPYYSGLLWAVILAIVFNPFYQWILGRTGGRPNLASAICLFACIFMVVIPLTIILQMFVGEMNLLFAKISNLEIDLNSIIRSIWNKMPTFLAKTLGWFGIEDQEQLQSRVNLYINQATGSFADVTVQVGQSTLQITINVFIMLYTLFYFFRDGDELLDRIHRASPFQDQYTDQFFRKFASVMKSTVKGNVLIAILQGLLGFVIFLALGLSGPLVWAVVMMVLSLLPAVGAAIVWFPAAVYLLMTGEIIRGLILMVFGTLVISLADNILRPHLVGKDLRLPDFLILISTVGGIALFGINGFVVGPLIAALFVSVWSLFVEGHAE